MDERGFTLIELLIVILVIGILAAIALPTFIGQSDKAHDASVKSDVRNAMTQMESCYTIKDSYNGCPSASEPLASGVTPSLLDGGTRYRVVEHSDSTGNDFVLTRLATGSFLRTCTLPGVGGCNDIGRW